MTHEIASTSPQVNLSNRVVFIIGPSILQNQLLASFLERETAAACLLRSSIDGAAERDASSFDRPYLYLVDCKGKNMDGLFLEMEADKELMEDHLLALFNVAIGDHIEEDAVLRGVRGIFYEDTPMEYFPKGLATMCKGELWLSRRAMTDCIMKFKRQAAYARREESTLTQREMEILTQIASGSTNDEIAQELCISSHTVKSHIYNIFKKINAPNRLQAALWAVKNLSDSMRRKHDAASRTPELFQLRGQGKE